MKNIISGKTKLFGIIANPISQVKTPQLFNNLFQKINLDASYIPFHISNKNGLKPFFEFIRNLNNIIGINVSIPYKSDVIEYMDFLDEQAKECDAVNTIYIESGKIYGYNTDGIGFIDGLKSEKSFEINNKNILLFGAGGSAKSIAYNLVKEKAKSITIANRTLEKSKLIAEKYQKSKTNFNIIGLNEINVVNFKEIDLIVNATSCGLGSDNTLLFSPENLNTHSVVCDIVMNPLNTRLITESKRLKISTYTGDNMLIYQINKMIEIWKIGKQSIKLIKNCFPKK
jgi:shikimate dehydrogenase